MGFSSTRDIDLLSPRERQYETSDAGYKGFGSLGLRVNTSGRKMFFLAYRVSKKKSRLPLGEYPSLSLTEAREKAEEAGKRVLAGYDPRSETKSGNQTPIFVSELINRLEELSKELKPALQDKTISEYGRLLRKHVLPDWGPRRITSLTSADVKFLTRGLDSESVVRNTRLLTALSYFFKVCLELKLLQTPPTIDLPNTKQLARPSNLEEKPTLPFFKLSELWLKCSTLSCPRAELAMRLLLYSGLPESSLKKLAPPTSPTNYSSLKLKNSKGRVFQLPLTKDLESLVREVVSLNEAKGEKFLFSSPTKPGPISSFRYYVSRISSTNDEELPISASLIRQSIPSAWRLIGFKPHVINGLFYPFRSKQSSSLSNPETSQVYREEYLTSLSNWIEFLENPKLFKNLEPRILGENPEKPLNKPELNVAPKSKPSAKVIQLAKHKDFKPIK